MKTSIRVIKLASILPEWVYGREFLVKVAVAHAMIHAMRSG